MSEEPGHEPGAEEPLRMPELHRRIEKILVPVDGSAGSELGIAWADLVADATGAEIIVVVAFDPPLAIRRRGILEAERLRSGMEEDARGLATEATLLFTGRGRRARGIVVRGDLRRPSCRRLRRSSST